MYPRFKSRQRSRASAEYTRSAFRWRDGALTLAKMAEPLDIRWSRPLPDGAEPSTVTVSRDAAGRWHVSLLCEVTVHDGRADRMRWSGWTRGSRLWSTLSTGEKVANPRHERRDRQRLARAQRQLARKAARIGEPGEGPPEGGPRARADRRPAPGSPAQAVDSARPREPSGRDRGPGGPQHARQPRARPRHQRRGLAGTAGHVGVQVPVVRPRPGRGRPLVPVVEGVLRVRDPARRACRCTCGSGRAAAGRCTTGT